MHSWRIVPCLLLSCLAVACGTSYQSVETTTETPPSQVQAGISEILMPAPVGIGTVGYFGASYVAEPSPFSKKYAATTRVHGQPAFRVVVISRGPGQEIVFVRSDMVGVFQQFRRAIVLEAESRLGRPLDNAVVIGGTHTHSGPGRILDGGGVYDLIADKFFPEFYERMVHAAASAIVDAFENLAPARIGHTWAQSKPGHSDRRCEDGRDYTNDALPIVVVERAGKIDALVFAYSVHGTALGIEDLTLSRDVAGAIEEQIEGRFDHPVLSLFFNSWGADMAPGHPDVVPETGAAQPSGYERMNKVGYAVANAIEVALGKISWEQDPEIFAEVQRVPLNRTAIGYADDEFPYQWGGVFCGGSSDVDCDPSTTVEGLDHSCIPFPEQYPVPPQTELSAGRIGQLAFVTFPGEPGTLLAEKVLARLRDGYGQSNVMFLGYSQDYTGYSILEDDWWQGGYEASGAIWGPRQGEYLTVAAENVFRRIVVERAERDPLEPQPLRPFQVGDYAPYVPTNAIDPGTIAEDVRPTYAPTEVVTLTVRGSDPWLGAPTATLLDSNGSPVIRAGRNLDSNGYAFWVDLKPVPGYKADRNAAERTFLWTFSMPAAQTVPGMVPHLNGTYRLRVSVPTTTGNIEVTSAAFQIGA